MCLQTKVLDSLQVILNIFFTLLFQKMGRSGDEKRNILRGWPSEDIDDFNDNKFNSEVVLTLWLLTRFVRSRWLDIGLVLCLRVYGPRLRLGP